MTHDEASRKAVDRLFTAIAHMNDYQDDEIEELLEEAVSYITEGTIQAIKHNLSPESTLRLREMQTLIRMRNESLERDDWEKFFWGKGRGMSKLSELTEQIAELIGAYTMDLFDTVYEKVKRETIEDVLSLIDGSQTYKMAAGEKDTYIDKRVIREAVEALREEGA